MSDNDMARLQAGDIKEAVGLLTRLPVTSSGTRGARAAWAWPLAGVVVTVLAVTLGWIGMLFGLPTTLVAAVVLGTQIILTGALHEDGLADCADGFWGGFDREKRLAIMKDSQIGTYGTIALILSLIIRWSAITALIEAGWLFGSLVAVAALSRVSMVALMTVLPPARKTGLSRAVGRPDKDVLTLASITAVAVAFLCAGFATLPAILVVAGLTYGIGRLAQNRINGQTGDVLGAAQQISEIGVLALLVSTL
ncbi:MAG: adenosylcobinamide-GDP ribazoletransferase [Paracoccaceae bacterium]